MDIRKGDVIKTRTTEDGEEYSESTFTVLASFTSDGNELFVDAELFPVYQVLLMVCCGQEYFVFNTESEMVFPGGMSAISFDDIVSIERGGKLIDLLKTEEEN